MTGLTILAAYVMAMFLVVAVVNFKVGNDRGTKIFAMLFFIFPVLLLCSLVIGSGL